MHAILLCAGFGTRLYPLTRDVAKPLLPVAGTPIVEHLVRQLWGTGRVREFTIVSNHRFHEAFERWSHAAAGRLPGALLHVLDDGTTADEQRLGAVRDLALALARLRPRDGVIVAAGDNLFAFDMGGFVSDYLSSPRHLVLRYAETSRERLRRTGVAEIDEAGRLVRLWEKPETAPSHWACPALYIFQPDVASPLDRFLAEVPDADAPGHFVSWLALREAVFTHEMRGRRLDVGDPEGYARAEAWLDAAGGSHAV